MRNHEASQRSDCVYEITRKVAKREGTGPTGLDPLQETIDIDALTKLIDSPYGNDLAVGFSYHGYYVNINGNGEVSVTSGSHHMLMN